MIRMYIEKSYGNEGRAAHIIQNFESISDVNLYTGMFNSDCHISFEEVFDEDSPTDSL